MKNSDGAPAYTRFMLAAMVRSSTGSHVAATGRCSDTFRVLIRLVVITILAIGSIALGPAPRAAAAGDANRATCSVQTESSPGFRVSLPDCRAYELVTPPRKNGQPPFTPEGAISTEGKVAYFSLGAFDEPGNSTTILGGEYVGERGGSAWSITPINPSGQVFQGGAFGSDHETLDFNEDLTESLILQPLRTAKPIDYHFYRRSVSDGSLVEIGPLSPPATVSAWSPSVNEGSGGPSVQYRGGSADLSHVVFSLQTIREPGPLEWTWPGDKTLTKAPGESLYEYSGTNNSEPELIGVRNAAALDTAAAEEHRAHVNEAAELISECGVALGGVSTAGLQTVDAYNAVSRTGDVIYFAPILGGCEESLSGGGQRIGSGPTVLELYSRVDREKTVDISEPTVGPSGDCETCDVSEPENAMFQGASEDGSIAFFISEQRLFDGANGEAGTNLYEFDQDGPAHHKLSFVAPHLAESEGLPGGVMRVTETGSSVYFVSKAATLATDSVNASGQSPQPEEPNLYARDTTSGSTTFVGTLSPQDEAEWAARDFRGVEATKDGRYLLFSSLAHLTNDTSGVGRQLYRFEAPSAEKPDGELVRVSVGSAGLYFCGQTDVVESGFNCNGNAAAPPSSVFASGYTRGSTAGSFLDATLAKPQGVAISNDGASVFFGSPEALAPGALNDVCAYESFGVCRVSAENIYEWSGGQIYLLSDGRDSNSLLAASPATRLMGADPSGENVFMTTTSALVPQDTDSQIDLYDVRTNGGFPPEATPVPCSSTCHSGGPPPSFIAPASVTTQGSEDVEEAPSPAVKQSQPLRLTRAQKLRKALHACARLRRGKRSRCEGLARQRYGPKRSAASRAKGAR